jgi:4-amino-4-deoxy-L-arabinose transferase-like glycosyltransferase
MTSLPEELSRRTHVLLGAIVCAGLLLRLLYIAHATARPGYRLDDPDSYLRQGEGIALGDTGWRFDFEVVEHAVEGRRYVLPPLYPVFLSLFALLPGFPLNVLAGQAMLAALGCFCAFLLGREIHSDRAGLIGAAFYALWFPNIIAVWSTMQETLFIPLVLSGFAVLLRARAIGGFALAGLLLGLAALTRSMPLYYVPVAAVLLMWRHGIRRGALFASGLALGFALLTVPYSIALSRHLGSPTFIENHAGLRIASEHGVGGARPPGPIASAATLLREFAAAPGKTIGDWSTTSRSILHVNGGRLLQIYLGAETKLGATAWKLAAHVFADLSLVLILALAPFGFVLCQKPDRAVFLAGWVVVCFGLTVVSGFGGPRLRAPFEPHLMVGAAVMLASGWRRPRPFALWGAGIVSLALLYAVVPQLGRSFAAKGDYGVDWPLDPPPKRSPIAGKAGFNVLVSDGFVELAVRPRNDGKSTRVSFFLEGELVGDEVVVATEHWFRYPTEKAGLAYVELVSQDAEVGTPVRALIVVPK